MNSSTKPTKIYKDKIVLFSNLFLLIYVILILIFSYIFNVEFLKANLFGMEINLAYVLIIMTVLEFISTLTFQRRMYLTALYKDEHRKDEKQIMRVAIALVAAFSWLIAGLQGILLIADSDNIYKALIKFVPVLIATFNGVYICLGAYN